jgi:mono/diheme cytochrome c family protein
MGTFLQRFVLGFAVVAALCFWIHPARVASSSMGERRTELQKGRDAKTLYDQSCASCHGKDGRAKSFRGKHTHAQDLTDTKWQERVSDERIFNSVSNGKGKMPAFSKKFSEAEINALVDYVRHLKK